MTSRSPNYRVKSTTFQLAWVVKRLATRIEHVHTYSNLPQLLPAAAVGEVRQVSILVAKPTHLRHKAEGVDPGG